MNKKQPRIKESLLLGTIIALGVFSIAINNIPVQALHKEEQKLDKFDNLKEFADAVKNGDAKIDKIPLLSMKASKIYDDADKQTQDCINLAAKIGKNLVSKEVVHCVDDVNFFNTKFSSNSSVPTTKTSTDTGTTTDTGTSKDTGTDVKSTSGDVKENNMINELVKTGKFTENEAKDFVSKTMQNGADGGSTSDSPKTSNADTSTSNTQASDNSQSTSSQDNNANTQSTSSQDNANTQSTSSQDNNANTQSSNNQDNNNQPSNNSNQAIDYNDLKELVHSVKNHVVDSDDITLNAFKDSGAYQGADEATQKCIDLAGKIGNKLGDQEIVHCSEDPNFYQNQISSNSNNANDNNANDNNANDNNANDNSNSNDKNSGGTGN